MNSISNQLDIIVVIHHYFCLTILDFPTLKLMQTMANTKKLDKKERKAAKRKAVKQLKEMFRKLDKQGRKKLKESKQGIKAFMNKGDKE